MNKPSWNDDVLIEEHPDWNQSPHELSGDLTTRSDLNGIVNARQHRRHRTDPEGLDNILEAPFELVSVEGKGKNINTTAGDVIGHNGHDIEHVAANDGGKHINTRVGCVAAGDEPISSSAIHPINSPTPAGSPAGMNRGMFQHAVQVLAKFSRFVGPGLMVSVAYIDPGNYATDVSAGAEYRFKLLVMVLVSNVFAIYLQSLCIKLGSVTGLNLAEMIKAECPKWLNYILYVFGEAAIIAVFRSKCQSCRIDLD